MHLGKTHRINDADIILEYYRQKKGYHRYNLPETSLFSKICEAIENPLKNIISLGSLALSTAVLTSATKTITDACINTLFNLDFHFFINTFTKETFISNAKFGVWGLLFNLAYISLKSYIHYDKLPSFNFYKDPIEAAKIGCNIGIRTGISVSLMKNTLRNMFIIKYLPKKISGPIIWLILGYSYYKLAKNLINNNEDD